MYVQTYIYVEYDMYLLDKKERKIKQIKVINCHLLIPMCNTAFFLDINKSLKNSHKQTNFCCLGMLRSNATRVVNKHYMLSTAENTKCTCSISNSLCMTLDISNVKAISYLFLEGKLHCLYFVPTLY
jgi:hypothetical protein